MIYVGAIAGWLAFNILVVWLLARPARPDMDWLESDADLRLSA